MIPPPVPLFNSFQLLTPPVDAEPPTTAAMSPGLPTQRGTYAGHPASFLLDSGASLNYVSAAFLRRHGITPSPAPFGSLVAHADGGKQPTQGVLPAVPVELVSLAMGEHTFHVITLLGFDAILGTPFLCATACTLDFGALTVSLSGHKLSLAFPPVSSPSTLAALHSVPAFHHGATPTHYCVWLDQPDAAAEVCMATTAVQPHSDARVAALLHEFQDVFPSDLPPGLPPSRASDHHIDTTPGAKPPYKHPYRLAEPQRVVLEATLKDLLAKGHIAPSKSPYSAPLIFAKKADGTLRLVVDYRGLNAITVRNRFPTPLVGDILDRMQCGRYFSKMDLRSGFHQVRLYPPDAHKTAFTTRQGLFEWKVLPFGLCNAPATFQSMMEEALRPFIDQGFVIVYVDDIGIFSNTLAEHLEHIKAVLAALRQHQLFVKLSKCVFAVESIDILGHTVSHGRVSMLQDKVSAIVSWPTPATVGDLRSFLGLAGYYRRFIPGFAHMAAPLQDLFKKGKPFIWTAMHATAFAALLDAVASKPVLALPDPSQPFQVVTDASSLAVGAVLSQSFNGQQHPVAFMSHKLSPAERNYPAHEQELLAIVTALQEWRHYLLGAPFAVLTDNKGLEHFLRQLHGSARQIRWAQKLADYSFTISYTPGTDNVVADALSRQPQPLPQSVFQAQPSAALCIATALASTLLPLFAMGYAADPMFQDVQDPTLVFQGGLWLQVDTACVCVPDHAPLRLALLRECHDAPSGGHLGVKKTQALLRRTYWWPGMATDARMYVRSCDSCQRNKPSSRLPAGLLQPLPIPGYPWEEVSLDLITQLPRSASGFDAIVVFVDRLTKMVHFVPVHTTIDAPGLAAVFLATIYRPHGMPRRLISDRDARFTSSFWRATFAALGTTLAMSTAYHPQSDGQTERANRTLEEMLRAFVDQQHSDWDLHLAMCEFAVNNATQESTGETPFFLNYGRHPVSPSSMLREFVPASSSPAANTFIAAKTEALALATQQLAAAQRRQAAYANLSRREVTYRIGDSVYVRRQPGADPAAALDSNVGPANKLLAAYHGPYVVTAVPGPVNVTIALAPNQLRTYHVSRVKAALANDDVRFPSRDPPRPPPIDAAAAPTTFAVDSLVAARTFRGERQYRVRWVGYPPHEDTWLPQTAIDNCSSEVAALEARLRRLDRQRRGPASAKRGRV